MHEAVALKLHSPKTCEKLIFVNNIRYNFHQVFAIVSCWEAFGLAGDKDHPFMLIVHFLLFVLSLYKKKY